MATITTKLSNAAFAAKWGLRFQDTRVVFVLMTHCTKGLIKKIQGQQEIYKLALRLQTKRVSGAPNGDANTNRLSFGEGKQSRTQLESRGVMVVESTIYRIILAGAPPASLSANARRRSNYWEQREATRTALEAAQWQIRQQWAHGLMDTAMSLHVLIGWPRGKKGTLPDCNQLASYVKPHIDALEGLVLVNDAQIQQATFEQTRLDAAAAVHYPDGVVMLDLSEYAPDTTALERLTG